MRDGSIEEWHLGLESDKGASWPKAKRGETYSSQKAKRKKKAERAKKKKKTLFKKRGQVGRSWGRERGGLSRVGKSTLGGGHTVITDSTLPIQNRAAANTDAVLEALIHYSHPSDLTAPSANQPDLKVSRMKTSCITPQNILR